MTEESRKHYRNTRGSLAAVNDFCHRVSGCPAIRRVAFKIGLLEAVAALRFEDPAKVNLGKGLPLSFSNIGAFKPGRDNGL